MQYITLPGTSLKPSVLCLGAGGYGTSIPEKEAFYLLDRFAEAGGNFADSAHVYAAWLPEGVGASERTLGRWLRARGLRPASQKAAGTSSDGMGNRRDRFIVSTKGGHPDLQTMHVSRLSPAEIQSDLFESLDRLQVDVIDLYWLHRDDPAIPVGEILDVLNGEIAAGRIGAIGASNWTPPRLAEAAAYVAEAGRRNWQTFCASQIGWSLARVNTELQGHLGMLYMDERTLSYHRSTGLPVVGYSSQAQGFFSQKYAWPSASVTTDDGSAGAAVHSPRAKMIARTWLNETSLACLERAQRLAGELDRTPNEIALAYLFSQAFPGVAIIGSRTIDQLEDSLRAADLRLTSAQVAYLESGVL